MRQNTKAACLAVITCFIVSFLVLVINFPRFSSDVLSFRTQFLPDSERLFEKVPTGTEVAIYGEDARSRSLETEKTQHSYSDRHSVIVSRDEKGWREMECGESKIFRPISLSTDIGNLTFYAFLSAKDDNTATARALKGSMFEKREIARFLTLSRDLPLVDVGANLGLVALQAALQKRRVVAVEPIPDNALRLCRSVLDFGHAGLVRVVQNAASSQDGRVTLGAPSANSSTYFAVNEPGRQLRYDTTGAYAIQLDRLLEFLPFRRTALKIDVEGHEGHVLAGAREFFEVLDIALVWMEWEHVKGRAAFGGQFVLDFMAARNFRPHNVMSGKRLEGSFLSWPFTVLWRRDKRPATREMAGRK